MTIRSVQLKQKIFPKKEISGTTKPVLTEALYDMSQARLTVASLGPILTNPDDISRGGIGGTVTGI